MHRPLHRPQSHSDLVISECEGFTNEEVGMVVIRTTFKFEVAQARCHSTGPKETCAATSCPWQSQTLPSTP